MSDGLGSGGNLHNSGTVAKYINRSIFFGNSLDNSNTNDNSRGNNSNSVGEGQGRRGRGSSGRNNGTVV